MPLLNIFFYTHDQKHHFRRWQHFGTLLYSSNVLSPGIKIHKNCHLSHKICGWYLTITFPVKLAKIVNMPNLSKTNIQREMLYFLQSFFIVKISCRLLLALHHQYTIRNFKIMSINPCSIITFSIFKSILLYITFDYELIVNYITYERLTN